MTLAICSMHFTAMGAADLSNCFAVTTSGNMSPGQISLDVGLASVLILAAVLGGLYLDARDDLRRRADAGRISTISARLELALTHMSQGLALFDAQERIILVNARLKAILGIPEDRSVEARNCGSFAGLSSKPMGLRLPMNSSMRSIVFISA